MRLLDSLNHLQNILRDMEYSHWLLDQWINRCHDIIKWDSSCSGLLFWTSIGGSVGIIIHPKLKVGSDMGREIQRGLNSWALNEGLRTLGFLPVLRAAILNPREEERQRRTQTTAPRREEEEKELWCTSPSTAIVISRSTALYLSFDFAVMWADWSAERYCDRISCCLGINRSSASEIWSAWSI